jgi:hypothetical protein
MTEIWDNGKKGHHPRDQNHPQLRKKAAEKWAAKKRKWLTKPFPIACTPQKTLPRACSGK